MSGSSRIAKNTIVLYLRLFVTMIISLYVSRVVLQTLGVNDFGVYNVVGGVVAMFSFISSTLATATQRFLNYEIGKNDLNSIKLVFNTSVLIHILIVLVLVLVCETLGLWFLNNKLQIGADRIYAANIVYQCSILSFCLTVLTVPANALVIAYEKMNIYAYISILEVVLKLIAVIVLGYLNGDKLILYSFFLLLIVGVCNSIYWIYCHTRIESCVISRHFSKASFREMMNFSGWNLVGCLALVAKEHGNNILLNIFFGPVVNAARGVSMQINNVVRAFTNNIQMAIKPQITQLYSSNNIKDAIKLVSWGTRLSMYLFLIIGLPIFIQAKELLSIWLIEVPNKSVVFVKLILISTLIESSVQSIVTLHLATGIIKKLQVIVGGLNLIILPLSYIALKISPQPEIVFFVSIGVSVIVFMLRMFLLKEVIPEFNMINFGHKVVVNVLIVYIIAAIPVCFLRDYMENNLFSLLIVSFFSVGMSTFSIFMFGMDSDERIKTINMIKTKINN